MDAPAPIDWSWDGIDARLGVSPSAGVLDEFMRHPEVQNLLVVATRKACHRWGVDLGRHGEDMRSECALLLLRMVSDPAARESARRIRNGLAVAVYVRFVDRVKQILESSEWTGSRGMSTRVRRRRALARHAAEVEAELGRSLSPSELVESFNRRVVESRVDAARQGMLASVEDLVPVTPVEFDPALDVESASHEDDLPFLSVQARPLVEAILVRARAEGGLVADLVGAWLGHFDDDPPYIATVGEMVAELGLDEQVVRRLLVEATQLARDVLADQFGIHG